MSQFYNAKSQSFSVNFGNKSNVLFTGIGVGFPFDPNHKLIQADTSKLYPTQAIWDTGATNSVITAEIAKVLNLKPISKSIVHGVNGSSEQNVYYVSIILPNNFLIHAIRVTECESLGGNFGALIGMDVISNGDFAVSNYNGQTSMSFRVPSIERIDFVAEHQYNPNNYEGLSRQQRREMERKRFKGRR